MKENKATRNGHVKLDYPDRKSPTPHKKFQWKEYGYGRFAKCLIMLIGEERIAIGETYSRDFRATGLTREWLTESLLYYLPWLKSKIELQRPFDADMVYNRWHKQLYTTRSKGKSYTVGQSPEHARNDPDLIPLLEHVDALYKRNKPLSQAMVARACHAVGIPFGKIE